MSDPTSASPIDAIPNKTHISHPDFEKLLARVEALENHAKAVEAVIDAPLNAGATPGTFRRNWPLVGEGI